MKIPPARIYFPDNDRKAILAAIDVALQTGQLTMGRHGKAFEEDFARFVGTRHAVAVASGTSAIEIPLRIAGVAGREVLVPTNTFFATVFGVLHAGGRVRFMDADPSTFGVSADSVRAQLTDQTAAVIVVHIGGIVTPEMGEIKQLCRDHDAFLLEDAAHAHGSTVGGRQAGTFGDAASFSFYPTKVTTSAEGGMIVTDDDRIASEARLYRDQGKISFTENRHDKMGYNWRLSEPHAIIGRAHFNRLPEFIAERQRLAAHYDRLLTDARGITPVKPPSACHSNYYKYIAMVDSGVDRRRLKLYLREQCGVSLSGEVYEYPCHLQPIFDGAYRGGSYPVAEDLCRHHVCLPLFQGMTEDEVAHVAGSLAEALAAC